MLGSTHPNPMTMDPGESAPNMEEEYRLLVEGVHDYGICLLDPTGRVASWNPGSERIDGYRGDEIISQHFSRFFRESDILAGKPEEILRIATEHGRFEDEDWRVRKDGTLYWAKVLIVALRAPAGDLRGFGRLTRDLTDKKMAEETARKLMREQAARSAAEEAESKIRDSEERFRQLSRKLEIILDGVGDGITVEDRSGRIVFANRAAARAAGFASTQAFVEAPRAQVLDKFDVFDDKGGPFDPARLPGPLALEGFETQPLLFRARNKASADEHWVRVRAETVRDEGGRPELAVNIWHDVTDDRREEAAARSLARANEALSQSFDYEHALGELAKALVPEFADWAGVDVVEDGAIRVVAVANVDPAKVEMGRAIQLQYPQLVEASAVGEVIRTGKALFSSEVTDADLERDIADPEIRAAVRALELRSLLIVPLKTREQTVGALTLATVRSGRRYQPSDLALAEELGRRAGIALENALLYGQAQRAIRVRDEFLSIAGHELKTPLTALDLQLQSLLTSMKRARGAQDVERWQERLGKTIEQSRRLGRLVHELLDVSRITSGRLVLERQSVNMAQMARDVVERHASELARAGSDVSVETEGRTGGEWDASRLDQVVSNLLSNAIKYGNGKPILVRIVGGDDRVTLSIRDQGIGIAVESQAKIFQRFERAVSERNYGGLGLGLWIVREVVQAHGGSVRFESTPGEGSTFFVELPCSAKAQEAERG